MAHPIIADNLAEKVCAAIGVDVEMARRVVIDIQVGAPVMVYVEMFGSNKLLDVKWDLDNGVEITTLEGSG